MSKLENETAVAEKSSRSSRTLLLILGLMVFEAAGIFGVIEWMRPSHVQADGFAQDITFAPNELVEVVVYEEANQRKGDTTWSVKVVALVPAPFVAEFTAVVEPFQHRIESNFVRCWRSASRKEIEALEPVVFTEAVGTSFEKLFSFIHGPEQPQVVYAWQVIVDQSNR
ncbi:MAG: hypothetical protein VX155_07555 [Planctomycetota bacterium]|nr:hypothetical protein [Planctomycetota bacterium]